MFRTISFLLVLVGTAQVGAVTRQHTHHTSTGPASSSSAYSSTSYSQSSNDGSGAFAYTVTSPETGDYQAHAQQRDPVTGAVHGQYRLLDADGLERIVTYTADDVHGFRADVQRVPVEKYSEPHSHNDAEWKHEYVGSEQLPYSLGSSNGANYRDRYSYPGESATFHSDHRHQVPEYNVDLDSGVVHAYPNTLAYGDRVHVRYDNHGTSARDQHHHPALRDQDQFQYISPQLNSHARSGDFTDGSAIHSHAVDGADHFRFPESLPSRLETSSRHQPSAAGDSQFVNSNRDAKPAPFTEFPQQFDQTHLAELPNIAYTGSPPPFSDAYGRKIGDGEHFHTDNYKVLQDLIRRFHTQ